MEYQRYENKYLKDAVNLLNTCFKNRKITEKSFLWRHFYDFLKHSSASMVAIGNGKVNSFVCFTPLTVTDKNKKEHNFYSCSVQATRKEFRRQGLVTKLTQLVEKKLGESTNYMGFSNSSGVKIDKFSQKISYRIIGQMTTQYVVSYPYKINLQLNKISTLPKVKISYPPYFGLKKDSSFLNWRYSEHPKIKFEFLEITKNSLPIGHLVYKKGRKINEVSNILLKNYNPKMYREIVRAFANFSFKQNRLLTSYSFLKNKFWDKCFPKLSFRQKNEFHFTLKTKNLAMQDAENWLIQGGDIL